MLCLRLLVELTLRDTLFEVSRRDCISCVEAEVSHPRGTHGLVVGELEGSLILRLFDLLKHLPLMHGGRWYIMNEWPL